MTRFFRLSVLLAAVLSASAAEFYVAPSGRPSARGSIDDPWDLTTALAHPAIVKSMDTIWIRGGTYRGQFTSRLRGAPNQPIIVRQYPGERATFDGNLPARKPTLTIEGEWTWFWGLEFTDSRLTRTTTIPGSSAPGLPGENVSIWGSHVKVINCIAHDGTGLGAWKPAVDSEIYGNIIYNNGWQGPDRRHGHGIYAQNDEGTKVIADNIAFSQFGAGFHIYGSDKAKLRGFVIAGNVVFGNGFLLGGGTPAEHITLDGNHFFRAPVNLYFGFPGQPNHDLTLIDNYFGATNVKALWWDLINVRGNTFCFQRGETLDLRTYVDVKPEAFKLDRDTYCVGPMNGHLVNISAWDGKENQAYSFEDLQSQRGDELNGRKRPFTHPSDLGVDVFIRRNKYEPTRGHIIVYNWAHRDTAEADASVMNMHPGDRYELRNAENYYADIISRVYDGGPIRIPMTGWTIAIPNGMDKPLQPSTYPEFGIFVLTVQQQRRYTHTSTK